MKKNSFRLIIVTFFSVFTLSFFTACQKEHDMSSMDSLKNIDYPAAYIVNGQSNSLSVIKLSTNEVTETIKLGESSGGHGGMNSGISWPHHVYINIAKNKIAVGVPGMDLSGGHGMMDSAGIGKIAILDPKTGAIMKVVDLPMMNHNATFSPDGAEIWTSQMDSMGAVLVYDANTYTLKKTIEVGKMPAEVTFSADGSRAFVANGKSNTVTVIDAATKSVIATISVGNQPVGAWVGANNKMYVDNEEGQTISVIDVGSLKVEETVTLGFMPGMAAYFSQANELWVSDATNGKAVIFQRSNNQWTKKGEIVTGAGAHAIAFSSDGKTAYVTNQMAGTVSIVNAETKAKIKDVAVGGKPNGIVVKN